MNFLQLAQRVQQEAGISGSLVTVIGNIGELKRVCDWTAEAYEDIQTKHSDWQFLRSDLTFNTIAGANTYSTGSVAPDCAKWIRDSFYCDKIEMVYVPWDSFYAEYVAGPSSDSVGMPYTFTIKPDNSLMFWPKPDAPHAIVGEYYRIPGVMVASADTPTIPVRFQMAIVWRALMLYGGYEGAPEAYSHGETEYKKVFRRLELDQLPKIVLADSLI